MSTVILLLWRFPGFIFEAQTNVNPWFSAFKAIVFGATISMLVGQGVDLTWLFVQSESGSATARVIFESFEK